MKKAIVVMLILLTGGVSISAQGLLMQTGPTTGMQQPGMMGLGTMGQGSMMGGGIMAPGMMGQGGVMGGGMMGMDPGALAVDPRIPPEKREQIRNINIVLMQGMMVSMAEMQSQRLAVTKAIHTIPSDKAAAKAAWESMKSHMDKMMLNRLDTMAKIQKILGKKLWQEVHPTWFGPSGAPGHKPMMQNQ
jgi:Spy/CpxP family protein refolding chaperone